MPECLHSKTKINSTYM